MHSGSGLLRVLGTDSTNTPRGWKMVLDLPSGAFDLWHAPSLYNNN